MIRTARRCIHIRFHRGVAIVATVRTCLVSSCLSCIVECLSRVGWGGMGWDGVGWDGVGWGGMGWDGMGRDAVGRDGMSTRSCVLAPATLAYRPRLRFLRFLLCPRICRR